MEEADGKKFKKTIDEDELFGLSRDLFKVFKEYPIRNIRVRCLEEMAKWEEFYSYHADEFLEPCIIDLFDQGDDLYGSLLEMYIFKTEKDLTVRAIEFAISLDKRNIFGVRNLSKMIAGRLTKDWQGADIYPKVPSLKMYLAGLLYELEKGMVDGYSDYCWVEAERALRVISHVGDYSFLSQIEKLLLLHQQKIIGPSKSSSPSFQRDVNIAMLKATIRMLKWAEKEAVLAAKNK